MRLFEYRCESCGETTEVFRQTGCYEEVPACPECGVSMERSFTPPAATFSGPGFYATEYGSAEEETDA